MEGIGSHQLPVTNLLNARALEGARAQAKALSKAENANDERAIEAGRMFENLLLRLVVAQLRKSVSTSSEGSLFGESVPGHEIYGSLLDGALADAMSAGGGIGVGDIVAARLRRQSAPSARAHGEETQP